MTKLSISHEELVKPRAGRKLPQYMAALAASLGAMAAGSLLGWSSSVVFKIKQDNGTDYNFSVSESQGDWISSIVNLGGAAVCLPIGLIIDAIGRKRTMLFMVLPFTIGWLLIIFATNFAMLLVGRFITGAAGGTFCVTVPAYTSEIAEDSIRGRLGSFYQTMITVGILFAYVFGSYVSVLTFNIICACIPIIFGVVFFFMPESPNYLVMKSKTDEARDALIWLRGKNYNVDSVLNKLRAKSEESKNNPVTFATAIIKKTSLKALFICYSLMCFQQLSGINAVIFNISEIFHIAGAEIPAAIATIIISIIQAVATFSTSLVVDKLGRRILLLISASVTCLCLTCLGVFFFLQTRDGSGSQIVQAISWLPLLSVSLFTVAIALGLGPVSWVMVGELCTIDIRAFVGSTAGTLNFLLAFTVTNTFNTLNASIGRGQVFWMYAGIMLLGFVFIFFAVPETKGCSEDEIQVLLGAKPRHQSFEQKK